ncbi:MAG: hypothetical protein WC058_03355 [Phycisphaeraceae bacterium]
MARFTSRKFLVALGAQLAGLLTLIWPSHVEPIMATVQAVVAMVVVLLSALGYVSAEASIDRAGAGRASGEDEQAAR